MSHDARHSMSRSLFVLSTSALAISLASIDKAFEIAEQYYFGQMASSSDTAFNKFGPRLEQTGNKPRTTYRPASVVGRGAFPLVGRMVDETAPLARTKTILIPAPGLAFSKINERATDDPVKFEGITNPLPSNPKEQRFLH